MLYGMLVLIVMFHALGKTLLIEKEDKTSLFIWYVLDQITKLAALGVLLYIVF